MLLLQRMQRFTREAQVKFRAPQKVFVRLKCEEGWTSSAVGILRERHLRCEGQWQVTS